MGGAQRRKMLCFWELGFGPNVILLSVLERTLRFLDGLQTVERVPSIVVCQTLWGYANSLDLSSCGT
jgi:hypothetical protein